MSFAPQYITGEAHFRTPSPSERDKIRMNLMLGLFFFLIAGLIFLVWGAVDFGTYSKLKGMDVGELRDFFGHDFGSATEDELATAVLLFAMYGSVKIGFGIAGLLLMLIVRMKAIIPLEKGEYEEAGRFLNMFVIMGLIFGIVLAGFFIHKARKILKQTAVRVSPQSQSFDGGTYLGVGGPSQDIRRCPVCNTMMVFNNQTKMWLCTSCNKYQH